MIAKTHPMIFAHLFQILDLNLKDNKERRAQADMRSKRPMAHMDDAEIKSRCFEKVDEGDDRV